MLFGMEMKVAVIATGALLLAPMFAGLFVWPSDAGNHRTGNEMDGGRTYSIYLWQQPFTICGFLPNALHPVGSLIAVAIGGVWFHFFERPFLSAGRRK